MEPTDIERKLGVIADEFSGQLMALNTVITALIAEHPDPAALAARIREVHRSMDKPDDRPARLAVADRALTAFLSQVQIAGRR